MSIVPSDARLDTCLTRHVGLDDARGAGQGAVADVQAPEVARAPLPQAETGVDAGEALLDADAWSDIPAGSRLLEAEPGLATQLGAMDLSQAADAAAGTIADAFA